MDTVKVVQYASGSLKDQDCLSNMTFNFGIMQYITISLVIEPTYSNEHPWILNFNLLLMPNYLE